MPGLVRRGGVKEASIRNAPQRHVLASRTIRSSPALVWELLTGVEYWPLWGPSLRAVDLDDNSIALGTTGRVQTPLGFWLPFTITEYEPGSNWAWRIGPVAATGHAVLPVDETTAVAVIDGPLWAMPYAPVCAYGLRKLDSLARSLAPVPAAQ